MRNLQVDLEPVSKSSSYSQSNSLTQVAFLRQPKTDGYGIMLPLYVCNLLKSFGAAQRGEWPSGLNSFRQVTQVKLGRVRSNSGWVTSEA